MNKEIIELLSDLAIEMEMQGKHYIDSYRRLDVLDECREEDLEFTNNIMDEKEILCLISDEIESCRNKITNKVSKIYGKDGFMCYIDRLIEKRKGLKD